MSFEKGECVGGSCEIKGFAPATPSTSPDAAGQAWSPGSNGDSSSALPGFGGGTAAATLSTPFRQQQECSLTLFFSEFCGPCDQAKKLIQEEDIVQKIPQKCLDMKEIDRSEDNYDEWEQLAMNKCMGVPFFVNKETGKSICGFNNSDGSFIQQFQDLAAVASSQPIA